MRPLDSFSEEDLKRACTKSQALDRYLKFLKNSPQSFEQEIRRDRHSYWCEAALNTLLKTAHPREICKSWSQYSDALVEKAWRHFQLDKEPVCLFALGKWGSQELNLSSDIDLILIKDGSTPGDLDLKIRKFNRCLSNITEWGFVFRLDYDLRPGGRSSALITPREQFETHYWSQGEPWERLSLTRLRGVCGPESLHRDIELFCQKYSFRKYIDILLLDELRALRQKIHSNVSLNSKQAQTHLKLCPGGIRDIELFLQSLMVIHGGRLQSVRHRETDKIASSLMELDLLEKGDGQFLLSTYWNLRQLENLVQVHRDQQSHNLKDLDGSQLQPTEVEIDNFFKMSAKTHQIVSDLLGGISASEPRLPEDEEQQKTWLRSLGFSERSVEESWSELISTPSLGRARSSLDAKKEFLYQFVVQLKEVGHDIDLGLAFLVDFVKAVKAKSSFYSLLLREPALSRELAHVFSFSPYLSNMICSRPELIDSLLLKTREPYSQDFGLMLEEMAEQKLLAEVLSALDFIARKDLESVYSNLTATADEIASHLLGRLKTEIYPQSELEFLALGKWGSQDIGFRSDLDFIFVSENSPTPEDLKIAQRFISRLQDPHRGGKLYGVDLRLRPSGSAGPLIVTQKALQDFLMEAAEPWQRQSYLRARSLNPQKNFNNDFVNRGLMPEELNELYGIRQKLLHKEMDPFSLDVKYSTGGILDIELCIHTLLLFHKVKPTHQRIETQMDQLSLIKFTKELLQLKENYRQLRKAEQVIKLIQQTTKLTLPQDLGPRMKMAQLMDISGEDPCQYLVDIHSENSKLIKNIDPIWHDRT
ncbi:MAG: hypothetical protein KDD22_06860 [Bdellovibrionales bacterium]|nr:hypothetical protein [Bdellovibrionales bacterium]